MKCFRLLLFTVVVLGFHSVLGQVTTSSITGSITTENGEPLIGATIVATHTPSGTTFGTTTREDGRFDLPNLRVGGPYILEYTYIGYEGQKEEEIYLQLGQNLRVAPVLKESSTTLQQVVITSGRNPIMSRERTGAETNVTSSQLEKLPTISRSTADFYRLTPAADGNSFAGRNDQFNNFSLDGSIFNNPFGLDAATPGGQTDAQPISLDAIDQVTVSLAPYDVTQAGFTGATVNAVTKSGTNQFSGSVFGFYRDENFTGNKVSGQDIVVPDLTQTQFGFTLGGPIIRNTLFFFANAEVDSREDLGSTFIASGSGRSGENVARVSSSDLDAVSNILQQRFGYETGPYEGYIHETNSTKGLFKLDWSVNRKHSVNATYNFLDAIKDKPAHPSAIGRRGPDFTTLQFENSGYQIQNVIHSGIMEWRALFSNTVSNKLQIGYTAFRDKRDAFSDPFPVINIAKEGIRYIVGGHEPFSIHNRLNQDVFQLTNNLSIYAGDHTFTIGGSLERFDFDNSFNLDAYGGTFGPDYLSVAAFIDSVNSGALDGVVSGAEETFSKNGGDGGVNGEGWALAETNVGQLAFYAQDEWQATPKLNLTIGLRVDKPLYLDTDEKIQENLDRQCCYAPEITWFDEDGNPQQFVHTELPENTTLFSPRLGFNYDVKGDQTSQIRGGTGLFSGRLPFVWLGNHVANPNWFFYNYTRRDYKFPQVWRTNFGYDHQFTSGWIGTIDLMYSKDVNASMVRNYGIKPPTGRLQGVDNRAIYAFEDRAVFEGLGFPLPVNSYIFTNTDIGYSFNASLQIQRNFANGLYVMLGYNYLKAEDASSIEAEISSDAFDRNPALGHVNEAVASPSLYGTKHRILGAAYKSFTYGGSWKTTVSTFFQYAQGGTTQNDNVADFRFSYTYSGDINGDGSFLNDLIYIPTDSELDQMNFVSDQQREAFRNYIEQDDYLVENRGSYAEKYEILAPWYSQWDLRILQDFEFDAGNSTNTIQFSIDILNFGNLISSSWGVKQLPQNTQPIAVTVNDAGVPTYSFDPSLTQTFADDFSLNTRWQAKFGLRYIF
ncbi:MAG: TonB-dependent receptor [Saprospiraceae bacterium]|nr:TonB-dependent receptor [Saprospiraceae bacterium]